MTSFEADQRIIVSRRALAGYVQVVDAQQWPPADLPLFHDEIISLEAVAEEHPGKTSEIIVLVGEWVRLRERLAGKLK